MPLPSKPRSKPNHTAATLLIGQQHISAIFVRNQRARRYVLRLRHDGVARVTVPRGGSIAEAKAFAERNAAWLQRQLHRLRAQPTQPVPWRIGSEILFRGEWVRVEAASTENPGTIRFGDQSLRVSNASGGRGGADEQTTDLRPAIERHLRRLAECELPPRVLEMAAAHQLTVHRVTVRNQESRWGSCSRRGTISLNWRLLQTPVFVRDYIILHELMHLRQMNHSARYWREVESVCPDYRTAELWIKRNSRLLRS